MKKLTDIDVMTMRAVHFSNPKAYSHRKLTRYFHVNYGTIGRTLRGEYRKEVMYPIGGFARLLVYNFNSQHITNGRLERVG